MSRHHPFWLWATEGLYERYQTTRHDWAAALCLTAAYGVIYLHRGLYGA